MIRPKHHDVWRSLYVIDDVPGTTGKGKDRAVLTEQVRVLGARAANRSDDAGIAGLEDRDEPRDATLDLFLDDDVGILETGLRSCIGRVLDLHR